MSFETILTDVADGILTITLNRPERLNAWTHQMGGEMAEAIRAADSDDDIEAIVVTGAGRGFCAGADIEAVFKAQADGEDTGAGQSRMGDWIGLLRSCKPIVAAINGAAIGIGVTQVLPMDYLVAANDAKISVRFIKMGLVPELASSAFLVQRVGFGAASELMLTGKTISGAEAAEIKLVDKAVDGADLLAEARTVAKAMGENPQAALREVKQLISANMSETDYALVQRREGEALAKCYASPEHREAIDAFLNKRAPDFKAARASQ